MSAAGQSAPGRSRRRLALLALALPLAALLAVDLGLRALSWVPPDSPLLFFTRTHAGRFSPFVALDDAHLTIRPDWVNDGEGMRGWRGKRIGRQFLYPGFRPATLLRERPAGALRVIALGGSTTFGLYVGAEAAFPAALERRLAPDLAVEVVNLGCAGFASDRVAGLLETALAELEPDLAIVYTGHNEMLVGPLGPMGSLGPALRLRARLVSLSTLFAWLDYGLSTTFRAAETEQLREEALALERGNIPTWVPEEASHVAQRTVTEAFRAEAAARYARNLARMIEAARAADVPLLFVLPVANRLSPPAISAHPEGFDQMAAFNADLRAARALLEGGKADRALAHVEQALARSPGHALAHFVRAEALADLGHLEAAWDAYQRAIDLDVRTHRITSRLEATLIGAAEGAGVPWVDLRPDFWEGGSRQAAARLFVDHLHPTAEGHARVAERLAPEAARLLAKPGS